MAKNNHPNLGSGAYTLPDAARLLQIPLPKLRRWVSGVADADGRHHPAGPVSYREKGLDRNFDFYTLIELFTIAELRKRGLSMRTLKEARAELGRRYNASHPFALEGLLVNGGHLLRELGDKALLELGSGGQASFEEVVKPFCERLDFDSGTSLVSRYFPMGRNAGIVVDPHHSFGRPVIEGTNLATETIATLLRGGESKDEVAEQFQIEPDLVSAAWEYEQRLAA